MLRLTGGQQPFRRVVLLCAVHEPLDPEYSILKQRLARRMKYEGMSEEDVQEMDLVEITKVCTAHH